MFNHLNPTIDERRSIIAASTGLFRRRFYDPALGGVDLDALFASNMEGLLNSSDFPNELRTLFATTGAQPIDVFFEPEKKVPVGKFLKATLFETPEREYIFRDVLIGGRAHEADIKPGDRLAKIDANDAFVGNAQIYAHRPFEMTVEDGNGLVRVLRFPAPYTCKPRSERNVECRRLAGGVGYVRVASWPGILGIDVARETGAALKNLKCERLIVDLRGNFGSAGAGNLRLMSYLTPERIPVGFSLTRNRAEQGYRRADLPRFTAIPRFKLQGLALLWKLRKIDKSIVIVTEGLKRQPFHGHTAFLVNRHTVSGAEIVVQFAKQHKLATILGERTAGRSLSYATLELPHDFRLTLPIGDYVPWSGERFEGCGIQPDIEIPYKRPTTGIVDSQLEEALTMYTRV